MLAIWATVVKELTELWRDRAGLLVLLVMPMALVVIVSLVQDSVMQATGEAPIRVLLVNRDSGFLGSALATRMRSAGGLEIFTSVEGKALDESRARSLVVKGDYQFCVIVPPGISAAFRERISRGTEGALTSGPVQEARPAEPPLSQSLIVLFDPAVQGVLRTAVVNALQRVMLGIEFRERTAMLAKTLPGEIQQVTSRMAAAGMPGAATERPGAAAVPEFRFSMESEPVLRLTESAAMKSPFEHRPTAAQQNVPAWALFGMFFIVVPLSGMLIRERQTGTFARLMTMPVSPFALLAGKVVAYVLICGIQFALMMAAGIFLLPLIGTDGLAVGPELLTVLPVVLAASLAATGYGLMVGTLARTYEQASMFGAVSVVIAAALGGIMIPVYVMPRFMQDVSHYSPLAWGLTSFQEIFVRGGGLESVLPELSYLLLFAIVSVGVSGVSMRANRA